MGASYRRPLTYGDMATNGSGGFDNDDTFSAMRIAVLVLDGAFDTGLATVSDTLAIANALAAPARPPFTVTRIGVRRRVTTGQGLVVPLDAIPRRAPDLVVVPALGTKTPAALDAALERADVRDATQMLASWAARGARVAGACTATFLLGAAALLDAQPATTTWWLAAAFRERFPNVKLDESRMLVEAGRVITAGAALAHLDLALWIVRRTSPSLARLTGRHLVFDQRPSQGAYALPHHLAHTDAMVERFELWSKANLTRFSLADAARAVGASQRTLERRVHRVLGKSPLSFIQDLRVADALHQLETTERSIDEIAARVGYQSGVTLRILLRKRTGRGVRELRVRG
jgi:transcriptional regulator GlxA family with amidase domain